MSRTVVRSFALLVHVLLFNLAADILAVGISARIRADWHATREVGSDSYGGAGP